MFYETKALCDNRIYIVRTMHVLIVLSDDDGYNDDDGDDNMMTTNYCSSMKVLRGSLRNIFCLPYIICSYMLCAFSKIYLFLL